MWWFLHANNLFKYVKRNQRQDTTNQYKNQLFWDTIENTFVSMLIYKLYIEPTKCMIDKT